MSIVKEGCAFADDQSNVINIGDIYFNSMGIGLK